MTPFQKAKEVAADSLQDTANEVARSCDEYCTFEMARVGLSAALAALESHGYVLVPVEPSEGMLKAPANLFMVTDVQSARINRAAIYTAMLNAAKAERA